MSHIRAGAMTLMRRLQRAGRDIEPNLVVALAAAAVRDRRGPLHPRDLDQPLGDERPGERGRQRIAILVQRAGLERRQDVVAGELLACIDHVRADGAERQRALADVRELAPLPEVERDGDDLGAVLLRQPPDRHRGVEPAGIRQDNSFHSVCAP